MGIDVDKVLAQYEGTPSNEPMHGKNGEVRRNPSTDQKKARRRTEEARLLRTAAVAISAAEQRAALVELEALRTEAMREQDEERALDLVAVRVDDILVPGHVHELHTASTDWLLELPEHTASQDEAERALIAEATLWYPRVDPRAKQDVEEFAEQARNKASYTASQYGEHAEHAKAAFLAEAARLYAQDSETGPELPGFQVAANLDERIRARKQEEEDVARRFRQPERTGYVDLDAPGMPTVHAPDPPGPPGPPPVAQSAQPAQPAQPGGSAPGTSVIPSRVVQPRPERHEHPRLHMPSFVHEITAPLLNATDTAGLEEMTRGLGQQYYSSYGEHLASRSAALSREPERFPEDAEQLAEHMFGDDPYDDYNRDYARETHKHAAATLPIPAQFGTQNVPSLPPAQPDVDSNRAPALQEMADYTGFDGSSVTGDPTGVAQTGNGQADTNDDHARPPGGFPVSGSTQASHAMPRPATPGLAPPCQAGSRDSLTAPSHKESSVTDHAQCPTCGGLGRVAVRKQAYSGLPQVDQIVNADESSGEGQLPPDVAFPMVGWDPTNVQRAISETEKIMPSHAQPSKTRVAATEHQAQGRDNSGWLGDDGAKGVDYPGYSAPTGYDGSSNLGQPDPVYGFGGDQPPGPHLPFGNQEYEDFTNRPGQPYDPSVPHNNDQGFREVSQGESTGGMGQATGSLDPFVAAAQEEIARQQHLIETRTKMLSRSPQ